MIWWVVFLFVMGMLLIIVEFFLPGAVCGVLGTILLIASGAIGCYNYPQYAPVIIIVEILAAMGVVMGWVYLAPRSRFGKLLVLEQSQKADSGWVAFESDLSIIGATGKALTRLRPAGTILINGKRIDGVSEGAYIEEGATIRVIAVHGSRVVVEKVNNT